MPLPKRPSTYILGLLLVLLAVLVWWLFKATSDPTLQDAIRQANTAQPVGSPAASTSVPAISRIGNSAPAAPVDPANQTLADELHNPSNPPERDLEIVDHFIEQLRRGTGANPIGLNEDITDAMTGGGDPRRPRVFPSNHPSIRGGRLVDRWGTPFWFHPNSGTQMEIRSAGPDKQLFTADDIVRNPSPAGLGVTPVETNPAP